jgi:DNA polymerase III delta prime subunit
MNRPASSIIGNAATVDFLLKAATSESLGHAYLFLGPDGVGKRLAALSFARAANCSCEDAEQPCESCRLTDAFAHPELLILEDVQKPRWLPRAMIARLISGETAEWGERYGELIAGLEAKGYLKEPLPRTDRRLHTDGLMLDTDKLFGQGSVPSKECYTPKPVSDKIRKEYDRGDLSDEEYGLLSLLYEYPLSKMPYRGAIPIAYVTTRQGWKFTRPIQTFLSMTSTMDGKKIVIVDDAHKLTPEAQNCLLKTLEEPPPDSLLVLITPDRNALFPTIVSRCQTVSFGRLTQAEIGDAVARLVGEEDEDVRLATLLSENCPGRLLELSMRDIKRGLEAVRRMFGALCAGRPEAVFSFTAGVMAQAGYHRRKQREAVRQALELAVFWLAEVARVQRGLSDTTGVPAIGSAIAEHARELDRTAVLDATRKIERAFQLVRWNIDMTLLLDTVLLDLALHLNPTGASRGVKS